VEAARARGAVRIYSAGHSARSSEELTGLLADAGVRALADVRRFPSSRRHPQFERAALERAVTGAGLRYVWLGESLGGRRAEVVPVEQSANRAWTEPAFRHYADAMATPEFQAGFAELEALARAAPTAFLCAERLWWECHRRLLADLLVVRGWSVVHLLEPGKASEHALSEWARVRDGALSYPALL
jgi:uncharacterized protein (DUF488 family)